MSCVIEEGGTGDPYKLDMTSSSRSQHLVLRCTRLYLKAALHEENVRLIGLNHDN
jgi:hypothetical protein